MLETRSWQSAVGALSALGFANDEGRQFRREDVVLVPGDDWWTFRSAAVVGEKEWLRRPGLWKPEHAAGGQVLDLPIADLALGEDLPLSEEAELARLLDWVMDTRSAEWRPRLEDAGEISPPSASALTARSRTHTCQGALHEAEGRCWIDYRLVEVPEDLPPERMAWLDALRRATDRFRMVRIASDPGTGAVHARIDLSGSPSPLRDALLGAALPRLRATVGALLPAFSLIADTGVESRALALGGPIQTP